MLTHGNQSGSKALKGRFGFRLIVAAFQMGCWLPNNRNPRSLPAFERKGEVEKIQRERGMANGSFCFELAFYFSLSSFGLAQIYPERKPLRNLWRDTSLWVKRPHDSSVLCSLFGIYGSYSFSSSFQLFSKI